MSRPNSCIVASGKGGTGKTGVVAAVGTLLAKCGKRAAVVDMDMGQRCLDIALGLENRVVFDLGDVSRGICRLKQASVSPDDLPGLTMISASQVVDASSVDAKECAKIIDALCESNDLVLIDAPSGIGEGLKLACACSGRALMVVTPDAASVRDAYRAMSVMRQLGVSDFKLAVNRVKPYHADLDYDISAEVISEWLGSQIVCSIKESNSPAPLMGNPGIAALARTLTGDKGLKWPKVNKTLAQRLFSAITQIGKRSNNAESI